MKDLEAAILAAFVIQPIPLQFFRNDARLEQPDIPNELRQRLLGRPWPDITIDDWRMTGASIGSIVNYLAPSAFRYYLPSLLLSSIRNSSGFDYSIAALVPSNQKHVPRDSWWTDFFNGFDDKQKKAVIAFLEYASMRARPGGTDQWLAQLALDTIWNCKNT